MARRASSPGIRPCFRIDACACSAPLILRIRLPHSGERRASAVARAPARCQRCQARAISDCRHSTILFRKPNYNLLRESENLGINGHVARAHLAEAERKRGDSPRKYGVPANGPGIFSASRLNRSLARLRCARSDADARTGKRGMPPARKQAASVSAPVRVCATEQRFP